jgi:hypothetical protein
MTDTLNTQFFNAINDNNLNAVNDLLAIPTFNPLEKSIQHLSSASYKGCLSIVKAIIEHYGDKLIEKDMQDIEEVFYNACDGGHLDIIKFLVDKYHINPAKDMNQASHMADEVNATDILDYFWQDERVQKSLENDEPFIYKAQQIRNLANNVKAF